jgi:hypothetical protein
MRRQSVTASAISNSTVRQNGVDYEPEALALDQVVESLRVAHLRHLHGSIHPEAAACTNPVLGPCLPGEIAVASGLPQFRVLAIPVEGANAAGGLPSSGGGSEYFGEESSAYRRSVFENQVPLTARFGHSRWASRAEGRRAAHEVGFGPNARAPKSVIAEGSAVAAAATTADPAYAHGVSDHDSYMAAETDVPRHSATDLPFDDDDAFDVNDDVLEVAPLNPHSARALWTQRLHSAPKTVVLSATGYKPARARFGATAAGGAKTKHQQHGPVQQELLQHRSRHHGSSSVVPASPPRVMSASARDGSRVAASDHTPPSTHQYYYAHKKALQLSKVVTPDNTRRGASYVPRPPHAASAFSFSETDAFSPRRRPDSARCHSSHSRRLSGSGVGIAAASVAVLGENIGIDVTGLAALRYA